MVEDIKMSLVIQIFKLQRYNKVFRKIVKNMKIRENE